MPVADVKAVEQLQQALDALPASSAPSPELQSQHETGRVHQPPIDMEAVQQHSLSSSPPPGNTCPHNETSVKPNLAVLDDVPAPSQNPFPDSSEMSLPPASAGVGAWNPWADDLNHRSSSSPHYQPGSSDSDWDDPDLQRGCSDDPDSTQNDSPAARDVEQDQGKLVKRTTQSESSLVASAMAEAQHRLDQLIGLAAGHSEVEQTLAVEADLGYAWGLVNNHIEDLQRQVWAAALQWLICHLVSSAVSSSDLLLLPLLLLLRFPLLLLLALLTGAAATLWLQNVTADDLC